MIEKLKEMKQKYIDLTNKIADSTILQDQKI